MVQKSSNCDFISTDKPMLALIIIVFLNSNDGYVK